MTTGSRKKGFTLKFDLSLAGLLGVGVVCFCIFLWMFLLGVWSGQTTLSSGKGQAAGPQKIQVEPRPTGAEDSRAAREDAVVAPAAKIVSAPAAKKRVGAVGPAEVVGPGTGLLPDPEEDQAFFAVQVAAFKDSALAGKEIEAWQKKGFTSFSRPPEGKDDMFTRVYVGHFDNMAAAKKEAAVLARQGKLKPFIVLVPAD